MEWQPVKSDTENPAHISMHTLSTMKLDGKVLYLKEKTYSEQQILKISAQLHKSFSDIFSQRQKELILRK